MDKGKEVMYKNTAIETMNTKNGVFRISTPIEQGGFLRTGSDSSVPCTASSSVP